MNFNYERVDDKNRRGNGESILINIMQSIKSIELKQNEVEVVQLRVITEINLKGVSDRLIMQTITIVVMKQYNMNSKLSKSKDKPNSNQRRSRSTLEKDQRTKNNLQTLTSKAQPLRIFQLPQLQSLKQNFKKQIENPIHAQISMHLAKTAQRCLMHNNVITLYCLNQRKPLCVTCMYQNNVHKKHKVIPLNRANQELQEQIMFYINVVNKEVDKTNKILNQSHVYLKRVEREFPELISKVHNFYISLHQMLDEKKEQQLQHVQQTWARLRMQYSSVSKELENINVYSLQRIAEIKTRGGEQTLLLNRNIASHLTNLSNLIPDNLCQCYQNTYDNELKKFEQIKAIINNKLIFTSIYEQKISRTHSRKQSLVKNPQTPSPNPKSSHDNRPSSKCNNMSNSNLKSYEKLFHKNKNDIQKSPTLGKSPTKTSSFKKSGSSPKRA